MGEFGSLGITCGARSVAEECGLVSCRFDHSYALHVFFACFDYRANVVEIEASLLSILEDRLVEGVKRNQVLHGIGATLRLEHDQSSQALLSA